MSNADKLRHLFCTVLEVPEDVVDGLTYNSVSAWDSVGHMQLIAAIEKEFSLTFDTQDIFDFDSFKKGMEIIGKHGVKV